MFFEAFNEIDIYIEDTGSSTKKLHSIIWARCLEGRLKVRDVFPLGGREAVLKRCRGDAKATNRPRIYVIDGDLTLLYGKQTPKIDRLIALPSYCVENFLIDEAAALQLLFEEDPVRPKDQIAIRLQFSQWLSRNRALLVRLFAAYATVHWVNPSLKTVALGISGLMKDETGFVCRRKVRTRIEQLVSQLEGVHDRRAVRLKMASILRHLRSSRKSRILQTYVSGKDYLLPLMVRHMKSIAPIRSDRDVIANRLALTADLSPLKEVVLVEIERQTGAPPD